MSKHKAAEESVGPRCRGRRAGDPQPLEHSHDHAPCDAWTRRRFRHPLRDSRPRVDPHGGPDPGTAARHRERRQLRRLQPHAPSAGQADRRRPGPLGGTRWPAEPWSRRLRAHRRPQGGRHLCSHPRSPDGCRRSAASPERFAAGRRRRPPEGPARRPAAVAGLVAGDGPVACSADACHASRHLPHRPTGLARCPQPAAAGRGPGFPNPCPTDRGVTDSNPGAPGPCGDRS